MRWAYREEAHPLLEDGALICFLLAVINSVCQWRRLVAIPAGLLMGPRGVCSWVAMIADVRKEA